MRQEPLHHLVADDIGSAMFRQLSRATEGTDKGYLKGGLNESCVAAPREAMPKEDVIGNVAVRNEINRRSY